MDYLKQAELSLHYLAESEAEFARLKGLIKLIPERIKVVKAGLVLESDKKTVAERTMAAECNNQYELMLDSCEQVYSDYYLIEAKRARANATIEIYRSVNSSLKKGNI